MFPNSNSSDFTTQNRLPLFFFFFRPEIFCGVPTKDCSENSDEWL